MEKTNYLEDISEIKAMMAQSTRCISLSGLSGVLAGIYALIGAFVAYYLVEIKGDGVLYLHDETFKLILLDLALVALLSILTAVFLSSRKAKKKKLKLWDASSKRLVFNFLIPFVAGGIYILILLEQQKYGQTAGLMLLFYGLALVNASKYSIGDIKILGFMEIALGLTSALLPGFGFWLWCIGFGVLHIIYGTFMYYKYDKN
ncbi:MAG: hypothetical protein ACPGVE_08405 [Flavobacteriales bacterium]